MKAIGQYFHMCNCVLRCARLFSLKILWMNPLHVAIQKEANVG